MADKAWPFYMLARCKLSWVSILKQSKKNLQDLNLAVWNLGPLNPSKIKWFQVAEI